MLGDGSASQAKAAGAVSASPGYAPLTAEGSRCTNRPNRRSRRREAGCQESGYAALFIGKPQDGRARSLLSVGGRQTRVRVGGRPGRAGLNVLSKEEAGQPDGKSSLEKSCADANARIDGHGGGSCSLPRHRPGTWIGRRPSGSEQGPWNATKSAFHRSGPKRQQNSLRRVDRPGMKRPTTRNRYDRIIYIMLNAMCTCALAGPLSSNHTSRRPFGEVKVVT